MRLRAVAFASTVVLAVVVGPALARAADPTTSPPATSAPPTTAAPTSAPTTSAPTTAAPTTSAPTTLAVTTTVASSTSSSSSSSSTSSSTTSTSIPTTTTTGSSSSGPSGATIGLIVAAIAVAGAAIALVVVLLRRRNLQEWQAVARSVRVEGSRMLAAVTGGMGTLADPVVAARTWSSLDSLGAALRADLQGLAAKAPEGEASRVVASVDHALQSLRAAVDADRALRLGPPPPTTEQLGYSEAVLRQRAADFEQSLSDLDRVSIPPR